MKETQQIHNVTLLESLDPILHNSKSLSLSNSIVLTLFTLSHNSFWRKIILHHFWNEIYWNGSLANNPQSSSNIPLHKRCQFYLCQLQFQLINFVSQALNILFKYIYNEHFRYSVITTLCWIYLLFCVLYYTV